VCPESAGQTVMYALLMCSAALAEQEMCVLNVQDRL
jgi:hypothetical protein